MHYFCIPIHRRLELWITRLKNLTDDEGLRHPNADYARCWIRTSENASSRHLGE
jgi:hypothetical protein